MNKVKNSKRKFLSGTVVSDAMDKTVVVVFERTYKNPRTSKVVRSVRNYKVHDEKREAKIGNTVEFYEGRPISKTKYMYLNRVVN